MSVITRARTFSTARNARRREYIQHDEHDIGNELVAQVVRAIHRATGRVINGLRVRIGKHSVWLSGSCRTFYTKQVAQEVAMSLSSDKTIVNEINVE